MHADHAHADLLSEQVHAARTRMLFSHIPLGMSISGGLALLIALATAYIDPSSIKAPVWLWLTATLSVAALRLHHSLRYFKSKDRRNVHWLGDLRRHTLVFSLLWAAMLWLWPTGTNGVYLELQAALIGALVGIAASGAFMLTADRIASRLWLTPMLVSAALYCLKVGTVLGVFGFITVTGFLAVLWIETRRSDRRITELLYLRFKSDRVTSAQAVALREAEALSQAKGQFLATMSHEMRTPLHGILGLSRLIRGELHSPLAHERMNLLESAGQHLLGVINDVLDYSRLQAGALELAHTHVDLHELANEVTSLAAVNGLEKGLEVELRSELPPAYVVEVDAGRLKQILLNLLGNAVKFTEQGRVVMRLCAAGPGALAPEGVCFEVRDTGIGIPPDELGRVFDAFHQVDGRYERRASGSGLGLSIARQICLAMGGDLGCESKVGEGSVFRCVLPLRRVNQPTARAVHAPAPSEEPMEAATVLLVEDNPVNAIVARTELEQMGLNVALAENGVDALAWLSEHVADLVLMDCHMPEMNGFDATRRIRAIESQRGEAPVPIVALTASTQEEVHQACLMAGMNECLPKPFLRGDLLRVVRRYISARRRRAHRPRSRLAALASG